MSELDFINKYLPSVGILLQKELSATFEQDVKALYRKAYTDGALDASSIISDEISLYREKL